MECAVADEEWQIPRSHPFALAGVVRVHGGDIPLSVVTQRLRRERTALWYLQPQTQGEVLALDADGVADDLVAVAPTPARALPHLSGHPRCHGVEEPPASA